MAHMSSATEGRFRRTPVRTITPGPRRTVLHAADGVPVEALYEPCTRSVEDVAGAGARAGAGAGAEGGDAGTAIVIAHGFTGSVDRPAVRRAARVFAQRAAVVTFSFRGHGGSGGRSTVGDREVLDLAAAVAWARELGHRRVVTVGFSMGGSVVLRHAALYRGAEPVTDGPVAGDGRHGGRTEAWEGAQAPACARGEGEGGRGGDGDGRGDGKGASGNGGGGGGQGGDGDGRGDRVGPVGLDGPNGPDGLGGRDVSAVVGAEAGAGPGAEAGCGVDAVVAVSAPARWYYRGTAPMRRLHWVVTRPAGRLVGRYGLRTRIDRRGWDPVPLSPVDAVPLIAPTPLLIVHGDRDPYFPVDHPRMLAEAARGHARLWLEPGMGHAENAADETLLTRIADWLATA
ncbi:alpha/beta fold hydrolase [Streptomyces sp. AM 4-1-1]|uniref:alpha/beta hydrolase n=1 Tax=Streptomyces sp. AM 4-1-1 TaxID=3028710 RepID=UPI0023B8AB86|nr:alpha/beta fold hydrolase [Streptomyces sp. AM 4-1-1]WEH37512.1 alpha/beta fold hydrolase [Streptomyces sp. AM 4-1-1]